MYLKTIKQTALLLCLSLSTFLHGQITIDYPESITVECGIDLTPSTDNPIIGYPEVSTTCNSGITDITFSDNIDELNECGGTGVLLRFWSVNDNCGGFMTLLQRIKLEDNTPPEINCVADVVIECAASLNPAQNPELSFPQVIDCSEGEDLTIIYVDENEGDGFCDNLPEIVRRTWTVTDGCGNTNTCEQIIRVGKDPLLITCEVEDILHECNGLDGSRFAAESWDLSNTNQLRNCAQTECGPVEVISDFDFGRVAGDCGITGSFEVNYLIKDNCGNSKFKTVSFTLRDTTPPESFCNPIDFGVSCEGDETANSRVATWHEENLALIETCLFDNCGEVRVTSDFNANNFNISQLNFDCADEEGFLVNYILTDECGNETVKSASLRIEDNAAPTFENVPRDTSIGENDNLAVGRPTVVDNCSSGISPEFSEERIDNNHDEGYLLIRTWKATDDCGNMDSISQRVMVLDPLLSLACVSAEVKLVGSKISIGNLLAPNEIVKVFASDNRVVYNCFRDCGETQTTRSLAEDTYTVDIEFYTINWELICTENVEIIIGSGGNNNGGDNGDGSDNENPCNAADCEQIPPAFNNLPADMTVNFDAVPSRGNPSASDNCDTNLEIIFGESRTDGANANNYILTRTWTAIDDCGNTVVGEQVIRVEDNGNTGDGNDGGNSGDGNDGGNNGDGNDGGNSGDGNDGGNSGDGNDGGNSGDGNDDNDPSLCNNVQISTSPLTFNFSNLNAPNSIVKIFDLDYNILLECNDNCGTETSFSYETLGTYLADVQLYTANWEFICETRETVELSDMPIDNGGGNNGGGKEDCANIEVIVGNSIHINNVNSPNKLIKIFDENYGIVAECANDCSSPIAFNLPPIGNYMVDIQLYNADWGFICETQHPITVSDNGGGNNSGGNNGNGGNNGGNQSDNPCENVNISNTQSAISINNFNTTNKIVNIFDEGFNLIYNCFTDCPTDVYVSISNFGKYTVDIQLYDGEWNLMCDERTELTINENSPTGNGSNNDGNVGGNNAQACNAVQLSASNGQIMVNNLSVPNTIVKIFSENFDLVFECVGTCGENVVISDLLDGDYQINIDFFDENWVGICERIEPISLGNSLTTTEDRMPNSTPTNVSSSRLAISDSPISSTDISIYPNPASTELMVDLQAFKGQNVELRIYNQLAKTVWKGRIDNANDELQQIDLQDIGSGLYIISILADGEQPIAKKLLVNKIR